MRRDDRWRIVAVAGVIAVVVVILLLVGTSGGPVPTPAPPPVTVPPTTTTPPPATPSGQQFGASVNRLFNAPVYSRSQISAQLAALRATGATIARSDALWEATEPAPPVAGVHHYDWSFDDAIATALAEHDLRWLPIIDYSAPWAQSIPGQDHSPPKSAADYAAYAGAFARRYGAGGTFWSARPSLPALPVEAIEIWNEPDNPAFWTGGPDPTRYAQLYTQARAAIDAVDPTARTLIGGLSKPPAFLSALLAADPGLRGAIDGIAIHPYGPTPASVLGHVVADRQVLDSLGLASDPLYVTEFGWTTLPAGALEGASERLRPEYIARTLEELGHSGCGIAATLLYTWVTPERNPTDPQDWFGISPPSGGGSPDVTAFTNGIREALGPGTITAGCG